MRLKQFVKKYIDPNLIVNVFVKVNNKYYKKVYSCLRAKNLLIDLEHDNYKNYSVLKIEEIKQNRNSANTNNIVVRDKHNIFEWK